jgi:hypothetical protein
VFCEEGNYRQTVNRKCQCLLDTAVFLNFDLLFGDRGDGMWCWSVGNLLQMSVQNKDP